MGNYSLSEFVKAARYPRRALVELYGLYVDRIRGGNGGIEIMEEDWDNLMILDACRYDIFEENSQLPGTLRSVRSQGSHTEEFFRKNFVGKSFPETVYVCANPVPSRFSTEFADVLPLWNDGWNDEYQTVLPDTVVDAAIRANKQYPDKRLLVHFLQPHYPWIGTKGREFHREHGYTSLAQENNVWIRMRAGEVSKTRVWEIYKENLEQTLGPIQRLLNELTGKSVVTADHGNAFGEKGVHGHPPRGYIEELTKVPWLVVAGEERKSLLPASHTVPLNQAETTPTEERLANLGYI